MSLQKREFYKEYIKLSCTFLSNQEIEIAFSSKFNYKRHNRRTNLGLVHYYSLSNFKNHHFLVFLTHKI